MTENDAALCRIVSEEELSDPLVTVDQLGWLGGNIQGQRVLCLAAGGGRQSCLYAAAGASVTVVDLSPAMLERDRQAARERRFNVELIEGSMDDLSMLRGREFDLVIHPVSTCYVPHLKTVYEQVATVLKTGGLYISQHKSPQSLQTSTQPVAGHYRVHHDYYRDTPVPPPDSQDSVTRRLREPNAIEFLHRWEQLIGGLCRSGFVVEDLVEPLHAERGAALDSFAGRANKVAPYLRIKARRVVASSGRVNQPRSLWLPNS